MKLPLIYIGACVFAQVVPIWLSAIVALVFAYFCLNGESMPREGVES